MNQYIPIYIYISLLTFISYFYIFICAYCVAFINSILPSCFQLLLTKQAVRRSENIGDPSLFLFFSVRQPLGRYTLSIKDAPLVVVKSLGKKDHVVSWAAPAPERDLTMFRKGGQGVTVYALRLLVSPPSPEQQDVYLP
jgi:hypothetical protein